MIVKFYGTRGSIPVCNPEYQEFGGNTTCILLKAKDTGRITIVDAGTGIRDLGKDLVASGHLQEELTISFTHFHWDHIQGFPFFAKAYDPKQSIVINAPGKQRGITDLKQLFSMQMQQEFFPVQLERMGAHFEFLLPDNVIDVYEGETGQLIKSTSYRHQHPGGAYSFRVERAGKVLTICTDVEHGDEIDANIVRLAERADLLIHEAQYTSEELKLKKGWGHSSYEQAITVAERAGVKQLAITHHDPDHDDRFLAKMEKECQQRFPNCMLARDGMEIEL